MRMLRAAGEALVGRCSTLAYLVGRGLRGMWQSPLVQLIAVSTMAVCMVLLGTALLMFQNARGVADDWGVDVPVTVYLVDDVDEDQTEQLAQRIAALEEVARVEVVGPQLALQRLEQGLGEQGDLLDGIDAAALPTSLELHLQPQVDPEFPPRLAARLSEFDQVEEVAVLGPWVAQARDLLHTLRDLALGVGLLVSAACVAIVWSTIRLGVFARRSEVQILRLVGGTAFFVRAPFLVEGVLQGIAGSALALGILWLAFDLVAPHLQEGLALMFAAGAIHFFTPAQVGLGLAFGAALGLLGSRAAVTRHVEA